MRDRRNTNLSISSLTNIPLGESPAPPIRVEDTEKGRFLWLPAQSADAGLPSPLVKHERENRKPLLGHWTINIGFKQLFVVAVLFLLYLAYSRSTLDWQSYLQPNPDRHYQLAEGSSLAAEAAPITVQDQAGNKRWTVHIPEQSQFPLSPNQYREICRQSEDVSKTVRASMISGSRIRGHKALFGQRQSYYTNDAGFLDVRQAMEGGLLPCSNVTVEANTTETCARSMTFVLETEDAGFGHSLLALWLSYGLAKKEGRAFFIDDTRWQYGAYASFFPPPPKPACAAPPPTHILPCPHQAEHLVVSAATLPWTFGSKFTRQFGGRHHFGFEKQSQIFDMMRTGYEDLFGLVGEDATFLEQRKAALRKDADAQNRPLVGMHIRRGDRHPFELEFSNDYLPLSRFTNAAIELLNAIPTAAPNSTSPSPSSLLLASDDPDILVSPDLLSNLPSSPEIKLQRAQDRIVLASKRTLAPSIPQRNGAYTKHVDENSGWEGGFFAPLFRSLGRTSHSATHYPRFSSARESRIDLEKRLAGNDHPDADEADEAKRKEREEEDARAASLRSLVGRAYLLDLAMLGEADGVVCAVSSASCRVLGVMMGRDAVREGRWVNVDDGRGWSWNGSR